MTEFQNNKKPAFKTDFSESRNDSSSALTSACIIANQGIVSRPFCVDKLLSCGPTGNRTPEILLSRKNSNHSGPTASLLYQESKAIPNS